MDTYDIIRRLLDPEQWPTTTNRESAPDLAGLAEEAFARDTFDGYLSSVLIRHQDLEDCAIILLRHAQFTVRLHLAGTGFGWPEEKYEELATKPKSMFGAVLQDLVASVDFDEKKDFVAACQKLNGIRNRLSHSLISGIDLDEIRELATEYKNGAEDALHHFNVGDEQFCSGYYYSVLDRKWDSIIDRELGKATCEASKDKWLQLRAMLEKARSLR